MAIQWKDEPEEHDYPAAASYLSLIFDPDSVSRCLDALRAAPVVTYQAKDIFRASGLPLLDDKDPHVEKDKNKISDDKKLSPLLLVRQPGIKVIVADGYHRLCAVYCEDEDAEVPCKIV